MAIKQSEERNSLKEKLRTRGLEFEDSKLEDALVKYNYFNLFNGIESIFLSNPKPKKFNKVTLDDFVAVYKFNKKLTAVILDLLNNIESKLKNSISYHFTQTYCSTINDTMNYTLKSNYENPQTSSISSSYPFVQYQNSKVYSEFDDFILFKPYYLTNLINKNDHIDYNFYSSTNYNPPSGVPIFRKGRVNYPDVAVPFWVAIETMTLGELWRLLHYLKSDILRKVMEDFNIDTQRYPRSEFLNAIDIILSLRNYCAHGKLVYRYQSSKGIKLNNGLIRSFDLKTSETGTPASVISLFDALKIVNYFENTKPLKKVINSIVYRNNKHFKSPDFDLNSRLLTKMGEPSLKEWKKCILTESQYKFK